MVFSSKGSVGEAPPALHADDFAGQAGFVTQHNRTRFRDAALCSNPASGTPRNKSPSAANGLEKAMSVTEEPELSDLLRRGIGGDEKAYAAFLSRIAGVVRGFARRKIAHDVDPEDVVQDTLLAIHLKRHTWRPDGLVLPWVFAIARYKLIDAFRRRGRRIEVDIADFAETLAEPEREQAMPRDVERALRQLPHGQRQVVTAISIEGQSISETARGLNMNETAVRVALHRGLNAIAKWTGKQ
jgi:RNA polymerase sigma-70 factor, ECF subfamily